VFSPPQGRTLGEEDEIEIVYHDPKYSGPTQVKKEPGISRSSDASRPPEGVAAGLFGANRISPIREAAFLCPLNVFPRLT
jgi:hypothetical protein